MMDTHIPPSPIASVGPIYTDVPHGTIETKAPSSPAAAPPVENKIPHHVNEVARLLKLNDEELVDALFPEGAEQKPKREDN